MLSHCNNGSKNVPQHYVLHTLPVLLKQALRPTVLQSDTQPVQNSAVKESEGRAYEMVKEMNAVSTSIITRP
jgi:hypothetical protein